MNQALRIEAPADYATACAGRFDNGAGGLAIASAAQPLPVAPLPPPAPPALEGAASAATLAGPFVPAAGAAVYVALWGAWTGEVRLLRSTDGGATRLPVTLGGGEWGVFTGNVYEPAWHESERGASLWLELAPTGGTIAFRVSQ